MDIRYRSSTVGLVAVTVSCLIGMAMPALAQDAVKSPEKWRPKDGAYTASAEHLTDGLPCEDVTDFLVYFRKKEIVGGEAFICKIKKLTDVATDAIRLDLGCDEDGSGGDPKDVHWKKEMMTVRKIDEQSFVMHMTKNGKFDQPEWRVRYCGAGPEIAPPTHRP